MTKHPSRFRVLIPGAVTLLALAAFAPGLRAQDTTSSGTSSSTTTMGQDTTLPSQLQPLFQGITLTADVKRQAAAVWERHSGGVGAGVGDSAGRPGIQGNDTMPAQPGSSSNPGRDMITQALTDELRALLTSPSDKAIFDQNVASYRKGMGHDMPHDSAGQGGKDHKMPSPSDTSGTGGTSGSQPSPSPSGRP